MSEFVAGFASRHQAAADALARAFAPMPGFAAADPGESARRRASQAAVADGGAPRHFAPQDSAPRHFSPADPAGDPTRGWNPLDPDMAAGNDRFVDPVEAARAAGYAEGLAAAMAENAADGSRDRQLLAELADALASAAHFDRDRMAARLRQTVLALVRRIVGDTGVAPELLAQRIEAAVELLADSAESAMLRMHPSDVPLVDGHLPKSVFPVGDEQVARGSFVLESASTIVEDGPELWLDQLAAAIDRVPLPATETPC